MKNQVFFGISFRIIILCLIGMFGTYISEIDGMREFFGDKLVFAPWSRTETEWDWGARHYWYFWMVTILFVWSLINLFVSAYRLIDKNYPKFFPL